MKPIIFALTTLLAASCLSSCADWLDYSDSSPNWNAQSGWMLDNNKPKRPRQHFYRGEQVGAEVPYSDSEKTPITSSTPAADTATVTAPQSKQVSDPSKPKKPPVNSIDRYTTQGS